MKFFCWALLIVLLSFEAVAAPPKASKKDEASVQANAGTYEWYFFGDGDQLCVYLSIGTPPQFISASLDFIHTNKNLTVSEKFFGGEFDNLNSTSYEIIENYFDEDNKVIGELGEDLVYIGGASLDYTYFLLPHTDHPSIAYFGLGFNDIEDDRNFLRNILRDFDEQKITIAFGDYPDSGVLTLGGTDKTRCYKNWKIMPQSTFDSEDGSFKYWGLEISKLSVGKFAAFSPGNIIFSLGDDQTRWPKDVYSQITKELGSIDGETIPCDVNKTIDFKVDDVLISLTPDVYLDREMEEDLGVCTLVGSTVEVSKEYTLPRAIFNNFCLSIDYERSEIGLATRRKQKQ